LPGRRRGQPCLQYPRSTHPLSRPHYTHSACSKAAWRIRIIELWWPEPKPYQTRRRIFSRTAKCQELTGAPCSHRSFLGRMDKLGERPN
jgi:hypothetical protein